MNNQPAYTVFTYFTFGIGQNSDVETKIISLHDTKNGTRGAMLNYKGVDGIAYKHYEDGEIVGGNVNPYFRKKRFGSSVFVNVLP